MQSRAFLLQQTCWTSEFSLQNSGSYLSCKPYSRCSRLCLLVPSYQSPVSGQCAFPTLSTSIYPSLQGYQGNTRYLRSIQTSQSHQDELDRWILFERGSILWLVWKLWIFHPLPSTPECKSWAAGMWVCDVESKIRDCSPSLVHPLKLILCNNSCGSCTSQHRAW